MSPENRGDSTASDRSPCARHAERPAIALCAECGVLMCAGCMRRGDDGLAHCQDCAVVGAIDGGPAPLGARSTEPRYSQRNPSDAFNESQRSPRKSTPIIPWEDPESKSDFGAFFRTVIFALTHPVLFMMAVPWSAPRLGSPMIYAVLVGSIGQLAQTARIALNPEPVKAALSRMPELANVTPEAMILATLPLIPAVVVFGLLVQSAIAHGLLRLIGAAQMPFATTFRVFAYAESAAIFLWLPGLGPLVYKFMAIFMALNGLRMGQKAGLPASLIALMPLLFMYSLSGSG